LEFLISAVAENTIYIESIAKITIFHYNSFFQLMLKN
jgi:hypothetical protein